MSWDLELSRKQALQEMAGMKAMAVRIKPFLGGSEAGGKIMVMFRGKWLNLCRTDQLDDVCTSTCMTWHEAKTEAKHAVKFFMKKCRYGARVDATTFAVIDSATDG